MKLDFKGYPIWLKIICALVLLPILFSPIVFYLSIFVFDDPGVNPLLQILIFVLVNSYSFFLIGICRLSVVIFTKYRNQLLSFLPFIGLAIVILLARWFIVDGPISHERVGPSDYRLFRNTTCESLAKAVVREDTSKIKQILSDTPEVADYKESKYGMCAIFLATYNKKYKSLETLLQCGADPNIIAGEKVTKPESPETPLMRICGSYSLDDQESIEMVKILLKYGADVNAQAPDSDSLLTYTSLSKAVSRDKYELVKFLLDNGADVNLTGGNCDSPLGEAIIFHNFDIAKELLIHGANPDFKESENSPTIRERIEAIVQDSTQKRFTEKEKLELQKLILNP